MTSRAVDQVIYAFGNFRLDPAERLLVRDTTLSPLHQKPSISSYTSSSTTAG